MAVLLAQRWLQQGAPPAKVVIIGCGVVGFNAALIAHGMKSNVTLIDQSEARLNELKNYFNDENTVNYLNDISGFFKKLHTDAWNMWELGYNVFKDNNFMNTNILDISCSYTNNYLIKYDHSGDNESSICEGVISSNLFPIYINKGLHTISTMKHTDPEGIIDDKSKIFINSCFLMKSPLYVKIEAKKQSYD